MNDNLVNMFLSNKLQTTHTNTHTYTQQTHKSADKKWPMVKKNKIERQIFKYTNTNIYMHIYINFFFFYFCCLWNWAVPVVGALRYLKVASVCKSIHAKNATVSCLKSYFFYRYTFHILYINRYSWIFFDNLKDFNASWSESRMKFIQMH